MNSKTALLTLAIAVSFAGVAGAQDAASTTTTTTTDTTVATTPAPAPAAVMAEPETPAATTAATTPMSELDMRNALTAQGYTNIEDMKFKDGMWTAEAKSADGNKVDLRIDGMTGKAIPDETVSKIDKDAVIAALLAAKFTDAHDVEFEDGIWKADAKDSSGAEVEVKLDGTDGHILGSTKEESDAKDDADEKADADEKGESDEKQDTAKQN